MEDKGNSIEGNLVFVFILIYIKKKKKSEQMFNDRHKSIRNALTASHKWSGQ